MNLLTKPEVALDFPEKDLSEPNARLLELMLANNTILAQGHMYAERSSWSYLVGHALIRDITNQSFTDLQERKAIDHGIRSIEAIAWLTRSITERHATYAVERCFATFKTRLIGENPVEVIAIAHEHFAETMPRTVRAITEGAHRSFPTLAHYVIAGAALMRQFELDSTRE
jgi:hypothetical protein